MKQSLLIKIFFMAWTGCLFFTFPSIGLSGDMQWNWDREGHTTDGSMTFKDKSGNPFETNVNPTGENVKINQNTARDMPVTIVSEDQAGGSCHKEFKKAPRTRGDFGGDSYCESHFGEGWKVASVMDVMSNFSMALQYYNYMNKDRQYIFGKSWINNVLDIYNNCNNWTSNENNHETLDLSTYKRVGSGFDHSYESKIFLEGMECSESNFVLCTKKVCDFTSTGFRMKFSDPTQGDFGGDAYCEEQFGEGWQVAHIIDLMTNLKMVSFRFNSDGTKIDAWIDSYENHNCGSSGNEWQSSRNNRYGYVFEMIVAGKDGGYIDFDTAWNSCRDHRPVTCIKY